MLAWRRNAAACNPVAVNQPLLYRSSVVFPGGAAAKIQ
jgi:hypothetical protein